MKGKRIFIVSTEFPPGPGGIGSHAYQVSKELYALGWEVSVFSEQANCPEEEIRAFNEKSPFKIFRLSPTPSFVSLLVKLFKLLAAFLKHRPDVVLGTGKHGAWFAVLIGKLTFTKTTVVGHGTEFITTMSAHSRNINNWIYSNASAIVYVSNYTKRIAEKVGIACKRSYVIHNGADDSLFYPLQEKEIAEFKNFKNINKQKIITTVGNVQPRKGHEWVIRAMPKILKSIPDAHYYCIGPPSIKNHLQNLAKELQIEKHVHFTGRILNSDLLLWLNATDVFVMTSIATDYGDVEGFGIAVIEAALCRKPAVVTSESGPGEAIIENVTGFGAKERDIDTIAQKLKELLQDEGLRNTMGENALNNAKQNLTWSIVVKKYDAVLSKLIEKL